IFFDEILAAPTTEELLLGIFVAALPELRSSLEKHLRDTNPLTDAPSVRIIRFALMEIDDMIEFGNASVEYVVTEEQFRESRLWMELLGDLLSMSGNLDGTKRTLNEEKPVRM